MLTTNYMQGQVLCCQIWDRRRKREEGPNVYASCIHFLLNYIQWHLSLFKSILFLFSSPAVWITKINKCISETFFIYFIFHNNWVTALCCDWFLLATTLIPSNIAHGIVIMNSIVWGTTFKISLYSKRMY